MSSSKLSFASAVLATWLGATGCSSHHVASVTLPEPAQSTVVGPGDVFEISVLGEKDIPRTFRVQPDGTVDFPYLERVTIAGLEPQEIEATIEKGLLDRILSNPQVTVIVTQYNSKKISIVGAVLRPGSLPFQEGMKLVDAISLSGGLSNIADGEHVRITRTVAGNKTVTATVSVDDITDGRRSDIPLQAGDTIKVEQRVF